MDDIVNIVTFIK